MIGRVVGLAAIGVLMAGCSSVIEGTSQTLTVYSTPAAANCILTRNGLTIGNLITPGQVVIEKTKSDIQMVCSKDGYGDSMAMLKSGTAAATFGNIIFGAGGGGIGWAIDSIRGADNKYETVVKVTLNRKGQPRA